MTTEDKTPAADATIGHNSGEEADGAQVATIPENETLDQRLAREYADRMARSDALIVSFGKFPAIIESDEVFDKASAFAVQLNAQVRALDADQKEEKAPILVQGRTIDDFFFIPKRALEDAKRVVEKAQGVWAEKKRKEAERLRQEADRLAREEADRLRIEAQRKIDEENERLEAQRKAAEAEGKKFEAPAELSIETEEAIEESIQAQEKAAITSQQARATVSAPVRTQTSFGTKATAKMVWDFEILDREKLAIEKLLPYIGLDVLEKAMKAFVKGGGRDMPGANIFQRQEVKNR